MCPISISYKKNIRTPNFVSHGKLSRPVLKEIIYNNILELALTRSIARKPQSFGGFKKIGPAEVEAGTKAHLSEKINWHGLCAPTPPPFYCNFWERPCSVRNVKNGL